MSERWKPEEGEHYWIIAFSDVAQSTWRADCADLSRWQMGNCFKTKEEAVAALKKITALLFSLHEPSTNSSQLVTDCNQFPKLTAEVFDRPDCPAWAKYAAVDRNGDAYYFTQRPYINDAKNAWVSNSFPPNWKFLGHPWDATGWQNSLIERPVKETKLPDWCKVGEWIYTSSEEYLRVERIDHSKIKLSNGATWSKQDIIDEAVPARLRPYNADEIPDLPFEVSERKSNFRTVVVSCKGDKVWLAGASTAISTEILKCDFTTQGKPCGVLEHLQDGEWVE